MDEEALDSDFLEPESEDFEDDEEPPSELELLFESEDEEEDSLLLELSLASFISRERFRVP